MSTRISASEPRVFAEMTPRWRATSRPITVNAWTSGSRVTASTTTAVAGASPSVPCARTSSASSAAANAVTIARKGAFMARGVYINQAYRTKRERQAARGHWAGAGPTTMEQ